MKKAMVFMTGFILAASILPAQFCMKRIDQLQSSSEIAEIASINSYMLTIGGGANWDTFRVFALGSPCNYIGVLPSTIQFTGRAIDANSEYALFLGPYGLCSVSIGQPDNPVFQGCTPASSGSGNQVLANGPYFYVITNANGGHLWIVSGQAGGAPQVLSHTLFSSQSIYGLAVSGNYLYIQNYPGPLLVYNAANPYNPSQVSSLSIEYHATEMAAAGNYLYLGIYGTSTDYLQVMDISDGASPQMITSLDLGVRDEIVDMDIAGPYLFLGMDPGGIRMFDISSPAAPTLIGRYIPSGRLIKMAVSGNLLAAAYRGSLSTTGIEIVNFQSCTGGGNPPSASFAYAPPSPTIEDIVMFSDLSTGGPEAWNWSFGDGAVSSQQNPAHQYASPGNYIVTLTVSNPYGSNSTSQLLPVSAPGQPPLANFAWTPAFPVVSQSVAFTDQSTNLPTSWLWNFGDGATSTAQSPSHVYSIPGNYIVMLTAANAAGSNSISKTVSVGIPPTAGFGFHPASPYPGETVQFTDQSQGSPTSWDWAFGDGTTANIQNPTKAYAAPGTYHVTLTVSNNYGTHSTTKQLTVSEPCTPPAANFTWSPSTPLVNRWVDFTDTSTGAPTSWSWNFGDGGSSTLQNPRYTYTAKGTYNVTLTVTNACGSNSITKAVTVKPPF